MQGMKTDAATFGIIDRIRQDMVYVDEQGEQQDAVLPEPNWSVKACCDCEWNQEMQCDVKDRKTPFLNWGQSKNTVVLDETTVFLL